MVVWQAYQTVTSNKWIKSSGIIYT